MRPPVSLETRAKMSASRRGRKHTAETRAKIAAALTGKKHTPERCARVSASLTGRKLGPFSESRRANMAAAARRGPRNPMWRGGVTSENQRVRQSVEYREWRTAVFLRDDFTCRQCGSRGHKLNADHILPFAQYPHLRFDVNNGRTLCVSCHRKTDTWGVRPRSSLIRSPHLG